LKTCTRCGDAKHLNQFYVVKGRRESRCKDCEISRRRYRAHVRYTAVSDITPEQELAMRKRARKCPMPGCGVKLTSKPSLPNSKHLDHIVPLNQGGTHTHGNVRIICADCNLRRPKDGSDFTGQVTLWAQGPVSVSRPDRRRMGGANINGATCRKGLHPWIPANIKVTSTGKKLCRLCYQAKEQRAGNLGPLRQCRCGAPFPAPGRTLMCPACMETTAGRAVGLRAVAGLTWQQVADQVGYESATGAWGAAKRIGYTDEWWHDLLQTLPLIRDCQTHSLVMYSRTWAVGPVERPGRPGAKPVKVEPQRLCSDCGTPKRERARHCEPCTTAKAWRAVELRMGEGRTLRYIADALGFDSITTVTNLMKTVAEIESGMGRPRIDDL
jgi:HNH endonuclease